MTAAALQTLERLAEDPSRFPATLLLTGPSDLRLESESRHFAARLLCPGGDPEGRCSSCRRVASGLHPDFLSVDPEGVQIRIERVREALAFAAGRPYEGALRVARIARADLLGFEAANALLKSLEEPGARFHWILTTTRPDLLPSTVRSRATPVALASAHASERRREWQGRGFSAEDARDLALFAAEDEADPPSRLEEGRNLRSEALAALEEGLGSGRPVPLLLLAEVIARKPRTEARVLAELLADAALCAAAAPAEALRHQAVAGRLAQVSRRVSANALHEAAILAADPPADNRKGNTRLHFEKVLLGLFGVRSPKV